MDWFLYDNDVRHERVKLTGFLIMEKLSPFQDKHFLSCAYQGVVSMIM